jgi:hypothetical protein
MIKKHGGQPGGMALSSVTPRPPSESVVTAQNGIELSEYETKRLRATVDKVRAQARLCPASEVHYVLAQERYEEARGQQHTWALGEGKHRLVSRYGRKIEENHCLATVTGALRPGDIKKLSTPVQPIETFGPASQRMLEEFRTEYMVNLAAQLPDWTQELGDTLSSGGLKQTYPLDFDVTNYQERTAQGAPATTPQAAEIGVTQKEYVTAKKGNLKKILKGDFAFLKSWQSKAGQMARARVKLRANLIVALLEGNPLWATSDEFPGGLDGENFFSQDHLINPFKADTGTASNLSDAGKPLKPLSAGAENLTDEKAQVMLVPHFDGVHMAMMADEMLIPTISSESARLLIDVKDVVLRGELGTAGAGGPMGPETNEHKDSGMGRIVAPQLAGTDATNANWYLVSRGIIAEGFVPWVLAEDPQEEIREWDQSSDYYKDTGEIKVQSHLGLSAVLLWWQAIRKVLGS